MDSNLIKINFQAPPDVIFANRIKKSYATVQNPVEHWHNRYEVFVIVKGFCSFFVHNQIFHMEEGDICIVPPNTIHAMSYPNSYHEHLFVNFSDFYLDKSLSKELNEVISTGKYSPKTEDMAFFREGFDEVCSLANKNEEYKSLYIKTCFDRLFIKILRTKDQFNKNTKANSISRDLPKVLEYINHNYTQDITLEQMADYCHVSPSYFSKFFKKTIGMGFKKYLVYTKLTISENLLCTTDKSISDIALDCGFNDSNYFSTVFKQRYGIPPLKYRKNYKVLGFALKDSYRYAES